MDPITKALVETVNSIVTPLNEDPFRKYDYDYTGDRISRKYMPPVSTEIDEKSIMDSLGKKGWTPYHPRAGSEDTETPTLPDDQARFQPRDPHILPDNIRPSKPKRPWDPYPLPDDIRPSKPKRPWDKDVPGWVWDRMDRIKHYQPEPPQYWAGGIRPMVSPGDLYSGNRKRKIVNTMPEPPRNIMSIIPPTPENWISQ